MLNEFKRNGGGFRLYNRKPNSLNKNINMSIPEIV